MHLFIQCALHISKQSTRPFNRLNIWISIFHQASRFRRSLTRFSVDRSRRCHWMYEPSSTFAIDWCPLLFTFEWTLKAERKECKLLEWVIAKWCIVHWMHCRQTVPDCITGAGQLHCTSSIHWKDPKGDGRWIAHRARGSASKGTSINLNLSSRAPIVKSITFKLKSPVTESTLVVSLYRVVDARGRKVNSTKSY